MQRKKVFFWKNPKSMFFFLSSTYTFVFVLKLIHEWDSEQVQQIQVLTGGKGRGRHGDRQEVDNNRCVWTLTFEHHPYKKSSNCFIFLIISGTLKVSLKLYRDGLNLQCTHTVCKHSCVIRLITEGRKTQTCHWPAAKWKVFLQLLLCCMSNFSLVAED